MEKTTRARSLRVAIVSGNTIVEERVLRAREPVTIGPSPRDTLLVPASEELPRSFILFQPTASGWELRVSRAMTGRVALDDKMAPLSLEELTRAAPRHGECHRIQLGDRGRGRIAIGELTVLYQLIAPPPQLPRPQLPPSLRGSFFGNLDGVMIALVAASLIVHTGLVAYARTIDFPRTPDIERLPDRRIPELLMPRPVEKPGPEAGKVDPKVIAKKVVPHHVAPAVSSEVARARLAAQVSRRGLLNVIGSKGEDGVIADLIRPDPGSDADRVFQNVSSVTVGSAAPSLHSTREGFLPGPTYLGGNLRAIGPEEVHTGHIDERRAPKSTWVPTGPIDLPDPGLAAIITAEVKKRKGAINACYERALHGDDQLSGKVQLRFTLSVLGKVVATEVEEDTVGSEGLARCMRATVGGWRFPQMKSETDFSYPFIFQPVK